MEQQAKILKQEIERRLASNQIYYAHFVTDADMKMIRENTTRDILELFEKNIDKWAKKVTVTTSLREEILHILKVHDDEPMVYDDRWSCKQLLELIAKRIDSMPQRFEYRDIEYAMGFAEACMKIKEMLK